MSANNTHFVTTVRDRPYQYGIYYVAGDAPESGDWFTFDKAIQVYNYPVAAIIAAHFIDQDNPTEYGVHVSALALKDVPYDDINKQPHGWTKLK